VDMATIRLVLHESESQKMELGALAWANSPI